MSDYDEPIDLYSRPKTITVKEKTWIFLGLTWHRVRPETYCGMDIVGPPSFWGFDLSWTEQRAVAWMKKHYGYNPNKGRKEFPA